MHQKHFVRILLFFYLFSSFVSATHIHHELGESHADCKVCVVVKNLHSADVPSFQPLNNVLSYYVSISELKHTCFTSQIIKGYNAHAPPLFS